MWVAVLHEAAEREMEDKNVVNYSVTVRATFRENFELQKFPFDHQLLRVRICHNAIEQRVS